MPQSQTRTVDTERIDGRRKYMEGSLYLRNVLRRSKKVLGQKCMERKEDGGRKERQGGRRWEVRTGVEKDVPRDTMREGWHRRRWRHR
jgi:hypothetical protein